MNETARIGHVSSSAAGQGTAAWQPQSGRQSVGRSWRAPTAIDSNRNNTLSAFSVSQCCPLEPRGGNRLSLLLHALRVAKQAGNRSFRYSVLIGSCHLACRGTLVTHPLPNVAAAGDRPVVIVFIDAADGQRDKISRGVCKCASILSRTNDASVMW